MENILILFYSIWSFLQVLFHEFKSDKIELNPMSLAHIRTLHILDWHDLKKVVIGTIIPHEAHSYESIGWRVSLNYIILKFYLQYHLRFKFFIIIIFLSASGVERE